jgi:hypothetical protein
MASPARLKALEHTIRALNHEPQSVAELASTAFCSWLEEPGREGVRDDFLAHLKRLVAAEEGRA